MAYIKAVQNGNFSSPSTWNGGVVPTTGDYACTLTNRIVLDIDTGAHLCVNQTDWVAAGGAANSSFQGGFDVPDGATRVITGSLRYDCSSSLANNSLTTAPLSLKSGSLTIDKTKYVSGYTTSSTAEKNVIYFSPTSTESATLTIVTSVDVSRGSSASNSGYYNMTIKAVGATSGMMIINLPAFNLLPSTSSSYMSSVLSLTGTTGFEVNMNGNFFNGAAQITTGLVNIGSSSTGVDNQKININTPTFGAGAVSSGFGIYASYLSSLTFMENTTVTSPAVTANAAVITVNYLRNKMIAPGILTSSGFGIIDIGLSGGSIVCGKIIQTVNGYSFLTVSGTGSVTTGDLTTQGTYAATDNNHIVSISSVGLITIGDIYAPEGALYDKKMLILSGERTSPTVIGRIDATNRYTRTSSAFVTISGGSTSTTTINGSVIGSIKGSATDLDAPALYLSSNSVNQGQFIINGDVKAGIRGPGLQMIGTSQQNVKINGTVIGADYPGGATVVPAAVQSRGRRVLLKNIDTGPDGRHPVDGLFAFLNSSEAYYKGIDQTGAILTLNPQADITPDPSDVRDGVTVGSTTGTLVVPQVANVLTGVVFDNGSVGTFSPLTAADLSPVTTSLAAIQSDVTAIKSNTDKMTFEEVTVSSGVLDPDYSSVVFLTGCNTTSGAAIFSAVTPNTITKIGSVTVDNSIRKFGDASWYFDGTGGRVYVSSVDLHNSTNFTVELFVYLNATNSGSQHLIGSWDGSTTLGWNISLSSTGAPFFEVSGTGAYEASNSLISGSAITFNTWHHLALVKTSNNYKLFIDGTLSLQTSSGPTTLYNTGSDITIGQRTDGTRPFKGFIDSIRITDNVARYSESFTPTTEEFIGINRTVEHHIKAMPDVAADLTTLQSLVTLLDTKADLIEAKTSQMSFDSGAIIANMPTLTASLSAIDTALSDIEAVTSKIGFETVYTEGDAYLAQTIFRAEFNGTNGSTIINADTGQTGTNQGSPSLNTAYTRTGTSSVALSNSMVSFGDISSLNLGANDFTIEFSVNFSSIVSTAGDYAGVIGKKNNSGDFSWICYVTESKLNFLGSGTNAVSLAHPTVLTSGTWYDIAISRTGDVLKFYVNGVLSQVSCTGMSLNITTAPLLIGRLSYVISSYHMFGYLDRVRITVGTGRYNSVAPVSPPISEYPTTLNGVPASYKVIANCDNSGSSSIPTDLTDRLNDLRNRINAIHFIVKDE